MAMPTANSITPTNPMNVAVRDVVMSLAAFTLARLAEVREEAPVHATNSIIERPQHDGLRRHPGS